MLSRCPPLCRQCCGGETQARLVPGPSWYSRHYYGSTATSHHSYIAITSSPPQSHTCTTGYPHCFHLGADISALMSYAVTAVVSLLVYDWCVHLGLAPTVQQRRVTRAESWARLRGGSSVYSAVQVDCQRTEPPED